MSWGISPNASEREKLKAEVSDYFHGLNSTCMIDYKAYSELYNACMPILERCYDRMKARGKGGSMKYIIMCGGVYPKWETPRHLTEINGEPLVARTIRLLRENGIEDIAITAQDARFEQFDVPVLHHENGYVWGDDASEKPSYWVDAFYPSDEPICYLMGDVFFSPFAIASIVNYVGEDIMFFASGLCNGKGYIKPWAEPFAFKVWNQKRFRDCINQTKILQDQGAFRRKPVSWELWQVIQGTMLNAIIMDYYAIDDYTCDVDSSEDAKRIELLGVD